MTWGKVGGQAPQGKDAKATAEEQAVYTARLDFDERGPACFVWGSRGHGRQHTLDLYVRSRASMWGGCKHEWALRRQRTGKLVHTGR